MKITEKVFRLVEPTITQLGYELYDVEFQKEYANWELMLIIDSNEGITLDDCERVSREVEPLLDSADLIESAYYLTVSSVGIDRPLKLSKDYDRNIGKTLDVKLYSVLPMDVCKAFAGKKSFTGILVGHDEATFTIAPSEDSTSSIVIQKRAAALLRPHIDFN